MRCCAPQQEKPEKKETTTDGPLESSRGKDRGEEALTAFDQSEQKDDLEITRNIRRALVEDRSLSFAAKNIAIIPSQGHVTLKGQVNTEAERASILQKAKAIAGPNIDNRLEVASGQ
ncbi:MAG: hyperosmotically inducible protein [Nitrospiraceae bacterium]